MTSNQTSLRFFGVQDADPHALDNERVCVLGYGNLGRAISLNLRDAGVAHLVVGNVEPVSVSWGGWVSTALRGRG